MAVKFLLFSDVSFAYDTITVPLLNNINVHFNRGWTGIIGANGTGKTTLLKLAAGELLPSQGIITGSENAIYCRQRTDDAPPLFKEMTNASDNIACRIMGQLNVDSDWFERWDTLSHGERKRAQIAAAIWSDPAILAIDEPTNHLDADARDYLFHALISYKGTGLLVSHDRMFLDKLTNKNWHITRKENKNQYVLNVI